MTCQDEFVAHGSQGVTFPNPGTAHSNHIDGGLQKCSAPEPLELQLKGRGQSCQGEGAEGLALGKPWLTEQASSAAPRPLVLLPWGQIVPLGCMGEGLVRAYQRDVSAARARRI